MHKLLERQLARYSASTAEAPMSWESFLSAVDSAYEQADADRLQLERSLDLASEELLERFRQLQADVVERQKASADLASSLSLLRATLDSTTDGIAVVDLEGHMVEMNRKFIEMWGMSDELIETRDAERLLQFIAQQVRDPEGMVARAHAMRSQSDGESDDAIELLDGRIFERHSQPRWLGGRGICRVWTTRDVTAERQRAEAVLRESEENLRQAQKMEAIGKLAGGVAHDFNNLLTAINGFSELVLRDMASDDPHRPFVEEIAKAGDRARQLTGQLLAFSRRQVMQPEVLSLSGIVADMAKLLQRVIGEDIELTTVVSGNIGQVLADPGQISQVILNLATNARDAMPRGGRLTIELANAVPDEIEVLVSRGARRGPYVALRVRDTGVGIAPEEMPRIFDPFFTTKEVGEGSGLGLSTVYGIVTQSGGGVDVQSAPDQGATFTVYLPRIEDVESAAPPPEIGFQPFAADVSSNVDRETLLLVEDEPPVRALVTAVLKASGHTVLTASRGEEALRICAEYDGPIHLLLTDIVMPGMSGLELSQHLVALRPQTKVLYMSGFTDDVTLRHGLAIGGNAFIQKPFNTNTLTRKIREVLDTAV